MPVVRGPHQACLDTRLRALGDCMDLWMVLVATLLSLATYGLFRLADRLSGKP